MRSCVWLSGLIAAVILSADIGVLARQQQQQAAPRYVPEDHRPPLFLRESWKNPPTQEPKVQQSDLQNQNLELKLYGPENRDIRIVIHTSPKENLTKHYRATAQAMLFGSELLLLTLATYKRS